MDDHEATSDQRQKELSIATTASSMINASDMISEEAYQANLRRIQEVKEMVQRLEMNNESAHQNFVVNQLENRAKDGREAEIMLAQLRNQPSFPGAVQFTNNVPSNRSEVILPTTATLVEVPDSHSSYPLPSMTAISSPQTIQQDRATKYHYQSNSAIQVPQVQSYNPNVSPYYTASHAVRQSQDSTVPRPQVPDGGQYIAQSVPLQSNVYSQPIHQPGFRPTQVQQPSKPWINYTPSIIPPPTAGGAPAPGSQVQQASRSWINYTASAIPLQTAGVVPAPGYYTSQPGWAKVAPVRSASSVNSASVTYSEPVFPTQSNGFRLPVTAHNQPQNLPSLSSTSQAQAPFYGVPAPFVKVSSDQLSSAQSHPRPAERQFQPLSMAVSESMTTSESERLHQPLQRQQLRPPPQQLSQPPLPPGRYSHPLQQQPQRPVQPPQSNREPRQPREPSSQPPQMQLQPFLPRVPPISVSRPKSQTSQAHDPLPVNVPPGVSQTQPQPPQLNTTQEQVRLGDTQPKMDQATFTKLFQLALQRGVQCFKAFLVRAKSSGISDEWFKAASNSLPRDVWESFAAQITQSGPALDVPSANISRRASTSHTPKAPIVTVPSLPITIPLVQMATTSAKPNPPPEEKMTHSASEETPELYTAQLQYYAEQATKSALSAGFSTTTPRDITSTQEAVSTPTRNAPQTEVNVRTPKDANKSTLARDVLWSLQKMMEANRKSTDNNDKGHQLTEVHAVQPSHVTPIGPPGPSLVTSSITSAEPNIQAESPRTSPQDMPTTQSVLNKEDEQTTVTEALIMIDLTLDDSDESIDGNGQEPEPTLPNQTSTSAPTISQPVSPTNTTNHTPLLENLSLEEPAVDVAADGDNADVRMYSPPSRQAPRHMESELLYPRPDGGEPVSSSFGPLPREASELPPNGQLPLFLPSPPASPTPTEPPETDLEMTNDEGKSRLSVKRRSVDADEMEIDMERLMTPRVKKRPKQQAYVLIPPAPLYVKQAIKRMKERGMGWDSELEEVGEDEEIQYSHLEQLLIEESKSRLIERRCRWLDCGAVLNCGVNLLAHLKQHAHEADSQAPFLCRWAGCQRRFETEEERDTHLDRHTTRPLPCPFTGCGEQFSKPVEVMQHEVQHQKAEQKGPLARKPTWQPVVPAIPSRLGPPPHRLPSHRVIPRRVVKCKISAERHATMGPWILWNIFSPVELNTRKQNASMRGRPARQATNGEVDSSDPRRDDYDFLLALSSYPAKNPQLDDLDSTLVTMSAARGLTLWGSGSAVDSATGTVTPEATRAGDRGDVAATDEGRQESGQSVGVGEEDVVERMLIG